MTFPLIMCILFGTVWTLLMVNLISKPISTGAWRNAKTHVNRRGKLVVEPIKATYGEPAKYRAGSNPAAPILNHNLAFWLAFQGVLK